MIRAVDDVSTSKLKGNIMKRNIAAALLALSVVPAFADDITIDPTPFVSTLSRAQVRAELQQFKASGVDPWAQDYNQLAGFVSSKTRAQVVAEYLRSRDETAALTSEDSGSAWLAQGRAIAVPASARSRIGSQPVLAGSPVNPQ